MKLKTVLLASALAISASSMASAQMLGMPGDGVVARSRVEQMQGFYGSVMGGGNLVQRTRVEEIETDGTSEHRSKLHFDNGFTYGGALGYAFGIGPRAELEVSYRKNNLDNVGGQDTNGHLSQLTFMANLAYDIYTGTRIVPYVGFGAGAARTHIETGDLASDGDVEGADSRQWRFAVQGFVGADYLVTQAFRIGLRYAFVHTADLHPAVIGEPGEHWNIDPNNHSLLLQAQYSFGAPRVIPAAPAPVAAPPAAPLQRNFLVFFDFDKSDITPEADRVIVQAANNAKSAAVTRITLTGHTDRAGPVAYNQRLSERRADAVKARLVREGVPAGSIVTIGRGESSPLKTTADGVREPQNRRVEIVL